MDKIGIFGVTKNDLGVIEGGDYGHFGEYKVKPWNISLPTLTALRI